MKKLGFTLAEVLITLGIIGVVAALTAPSLILSAQNEANASKLSVVVSTVENAFRNAMVADGVSDLRQTEIYDTNDRNTIAGRLGRYMTISGVDADHSFYRGFYPSKTVNNVLVTEGPFKIDGSSIEGLDDEGFRAMFPITLKNGAVIFIRQFRDENLNINVNDIIAAGGSAARPAGWLIIDVNGTKNPNRFGRDIFSFNIDSKGTLQPFGGRNRAVWTAATNGGSVADSEVAKYLWNSTTATPSHICTDSNQGTGQGCTARVIEQGYKINY